MSHNFSASKTSKTQMHRQKPQKRFGLTLVSVEGDEHATQQRKRPRLTLGTDNNKTYEKLVKEAVENELKEPWARKIIKEASLPLPTDKTKNKHLKI